MPTSPSPPSHQRLSYDLTSPSPRDLAALDTPSQTSRPQVDTDTEWLLNEVAQPESTSSRSSVSSLNFLLAEEPGQHGLPFSLPNRQAWPKSRNICPSAISLFKEGWIHVKKVFHAGKQFRSKGDRLIEVDANRMKPLVDERTGKPYAENWIRSNKYTLATFIPRQLVAQFSKLANFYFLCFAILQLVPGLSTIGNATNIIPLMIFVSISMAKEGFDDYRRHRLDKEENNRETLIVDTAAPLLAGALNWQKAQWRSLRVADIIKLKRDEPIPADIVLLSSMNLGQSSVAYVETIALDGETNLKRKHAVKSVAKACATPEKLTTCSVRCIIEDPNPNLSTFRGKVIVNNQPFPLTNDNIIYRGSVLRNTSQVTAMILYSGEECKIRLNSSTDGHARTKAPLLQSMLNKIVMLVVCLVLGLSIYNTVAYQFWKSDIESKLFYLYSAAVPFHEEAFGFIIMFATMVPLSLYVGMEIIKLAQIFFLNTDVEMYDEKSNTPFEARTSTINEDLGQVTHIFSDKTGTLTDNEMTFRKLYVAGTEWAHEDPKVSGHERNTRELVDYLSQIPHSAFAEKARLMLLCMALCHSCIPETTQNGTAVDFQGSSPDELALIRAAKDMGFLMCSRDNESITLALSSPTNASIRTETYEVLNEIDFSNDRKRMSIIVKFPDGRICVICKGADSIILERLRLSATRETDAAPGIGGRNTPHLPDMRQTFTTTGEVEKFPVFDITVGDDRAIIANCMRSVDRFANESLRTLLYAYRFLDENEYTEWRKVWDAATTSLLNRESLVERAGELIEVNFELAGATAIEDKLQQGVSETIDKLCRADIRIWMLTGDKRETAINIGHSCGLIKRNSTISILTDENGPGNIADMIRSRISTIYTVAHSVVVVDGHTLATIFNDTSGRLEAIFLDLAILTDSVLCCRAQPSQKAQLVNGMRKRVRNSITLAVGDGANDIAMIQEAHVGIGITGKEGFQAARSSDYSIAQFRFLQKLILVHGRWNYVRSSKYALATLWKEVVFFLPQALFQRWNGFTGTSLYEPWTLAQFNTLFTTLAVFTIGIFEKDLAASTLLAVPELYKTMGPKNSGFNVWVYFGWTAMAVAEAMITYFCMLTIFAKAETTRDNTIFPMGDLDFVAATIIITMKLQIIEMHNKSIIVGLCVFLSVGAAFLWNILLAATYPQTLPYRVRGRFFEGFGKDPTWWMTLVLIVICVYVLEISVSALRKALFPTETDVYQMLEHDKAHEEQFEEAALLSQSGWKKYRDEPLDATGGIDIALQDFNTT